MAIRAVRYGHCDACGREGVLRQLWGRRRGAESAVLVGTFAEVCFYRQALVLARNGVQPETAEARVIHLRGLV